MESFAASNDRGWATIQRTIDLSDYYVLVIAGRYGSIDPDFDMSWTEREYEYAYQQGIPSLVFIRSDDDIPLARGERDGSKRERLEAFKTKVKSRHHCSGWGKVESLQAAVLRALSDGIASSAASPRPGWARGVAPATVRSGLIYYHVHLRAEGERSACERGACRLTYFGSGLFDSPDQDQRYVDRVRGANKIEVPNFRPEAQVINPAEHARTGTYLEYQVAGDKPLHICGEIRTTVQLSDAKGGLALHIPYPTRHVTFVVDLTACEIVPSVPVWAWAVSHAKNGVAIRSSLGAMHRSSSERVWFATATDVSADSNIEVSWGD